MDGRRIILYWFLDTRSFKYKPLEKKYFGVELPIDVQQTMLTCSTTVNISELYE